MAIVGLPRGNHKPPGPSVSWVDQQAHFVGCGTASIGDLLVLFSDALNFVARHIPSTKSLSNASVVQVDESIT